ncbi:hypothetical protein EWQ73_25105, partial [Salmonella enterica]|nr:hypothetical protein [Salmonella enterica]
FCSICILLLYSFVISGGLNSSVLVNISQGSFAEACFSFSVVGLDNRPLERWFLRPLVSLL